MKWLLALLVIGLIALGYVLVDPFGGDSNPPRSQTSPSVSVANPSPSQRITGTACQRLAGLAGQLAEADDSVNEFLLDLGQQAGGISKGQGALADLARGGRNRISGKGFRRPYDDGSIGQVRHFVGYVRASMFGGTSITRWISEHLRHDPPDSPDGRLGDEGIAFAQDLIGGRLQLSGASDWLRTRLCTP